MKIDSDGPLTHIGSKRFIHFLFLPFYVPMAFQVIIPRISGDWAWPIGSVDLATRIVPQLLASRARMGQFLQPETVDKFVLKYANYLTLALSTMFVCLLVSIAFRRNICGQRELIVSASEDLPSRRYRLMKAMAVLISFLLFFGVGVFFWPFMTGPSAGISVGRVMAAHHMGMVIFCSAFSIILLAVSLACVCAIKNNLFYGDR